MEGKVAVILFPGTNCENETAEALRSVGLAADVVRWNESLERLKGYHGYVLPGGFSYEDRIRSGVIAAQDPVMQTIKKQAEQGKPVLGICNGAQVLVETGMVPGITGGRDMALAPNFHTGGYYCTWVYLKVMGKCAFTDSFKKGEVIPIPIAHGEGRFTTKDHDVLDAIQDKDQIIFQYCTADGEIIEDFPVNPNGSLLNIAGLCNPKGNVMALMPHPERASWVRQLPDLPARQEAHGSSSTMESAAPARRIFESMKAYIGRR